MPLYRSSKAVKSRRPTGKPTVAITIGDPAGIGPEIVAKALASHKLRGLANFLVIGDRSAFDVLPDPTGADLKLGPRDAFRDLKILDRDAIRLGRADVISGRASLEYIDYALDLIRDMKADCLATAPVSKEAISAGGIRFSGHTEYIAKKFKTDNFAMMLIGGPLRVTLATRHIPISSVAGSLTTDEIFKCVKLSHRALQKYFGIRRPRIGIASLNPHGGEGGSIGTEEKRIIRPAAIKAKRLFKDIIGPVSSEALFYEAFRGRLDCIIAMYHDQGLTALKMIGRDNSVNVTLGLPFIRTSPGHGTAFDIAGKGLANAEPMIEAIRLAVVMHNKGG